MASTTTTVPNLLNKRGEIVIDLTALTSQLTTTTFGGVIEDVLPLVAVAVLVGFLFYVIRWGIGLFRGI